MRFLLIRHGDPDYANDSLTPKGFREAELLSRRLSREKIDTIYCSPMGRAQKTAEPTAEITGKEIITLDWLHEIDGYVSVGEMHESPWDIYPELWTQNPDINDPEACMDYYLYGDFKARIQEICRETDNLLKKHGFIRKGKYFEIAEGYERNNDTVAIFCHMGLGNVILSYLTNISPLLWWHTVFLPPSSVTTIFMEKHRLDKNIAIAHLAGIGDTSHLYAGGEPVSTSGLKNCLSETFPPLTK